MMQAISNQIARLSRKYVYYVFSFFSEHYIGKRACEWVSCLLDC